MEATRLNHPAPAASRTRRRAQLAAASVLVALSLALLGGCLAEEGVGSGGGASSVSWNDVAFIVLGSKCQGCHKPNAGLNPDLQYSNLLTSTAGTCTGVADLVTPGDRYNSCLYLSVTGTGGVDMSSKLLVSEQELIGLWIDQGAPGP